jgi:5-methylcytosine-specific restriction endonuclease McrA
MYRSRARAAVRKPVLPCDGCECQIRLATCRGRVDTVDHVVELGMAAHAMSNLQAACRSCNAAKRNRSLAARAKRARLQRRRGR